MRMRTRFATTCLLVLALGVLGLAGRGEAAPIPISAFTGNTYMDGGGVAGTVNYAVFTSAEFLAATTDAFRASFVKGVGCEGDLDLKDTVVYLFQVANTGSRNIPIANLAIDLNGAMVTSCGYFHQRVFVDTSAGGGLVGATNNLGPDESTPYPQDLTWGGMPRRDVASVGFDTLSTAVDPTFVLLGTNVQSPFIPLKSNGSGEVGAGQTSSLIVYTVHETPTFVFGGFSDDGTSAFGGVPGPGGTFLVVPDPKISLTKTANVDDADFGSKVTYTYQVTNTGNVALTNLTVIDDNGTPGYPADDFTVGTTTPSLAAEETVTLTATTIPPASMCMPVNGQLLPVGTLIVTQLPSGDIKATYRQSRTVVDNTYGANAVGYPNGHTFNSLVGTDRVEFRFTNGSGAQVLDFFVDYISYVGVSPSFPSGYGTLGVTGSGGKMITGSAANVLRVTTSLTDNLNHSPEFSAYTQNSPDESSFPDWDYVYSYTVVVSGAAFGPSGFGQATVELVHNSPSKLGIKVITPTPCDSFVSNIARATATYHDLDTAQDTTVTAAASASVHVFGEPVTGGQFATFTQGGWGSKPRGHNPGNLLATYFPIVYPAGVTIGGNFTLTFTRADAIARFLPQENRPGVLTGSEANPTKKTRAGEFAGQMLALQLNLDFSNAGVTLKGLGDLKAASGKLAGWRLADVLILANKVLGGNTALLPAGVSVSNLNEVVEKINRNFESGTKNHGFLAP